MSNKFKRISISMIIIILIIKVDYNKYIDLARAKSEAPVNKLFII